MAGRFARHTMLVGGEAYHRQMVQAQAIAARWHELAIECGAEWDGMDGYVLTPAGYDEYRRRCAEEGI